MPTALEILENKFDRNPTYLDDKFFPIAFAFLGFSTACAHNFFLLKPLMAGIQRHLFYTTVGGFLGKFVDKTVNASAARRDAILRNYIELHPEDFPEKERKKFSEILLPWVPIR